MCGVLGVFARCLCVACTVPDSVEEVVRMELWEVKRVLEVGMLLSGVVVLVGYMLLRRGVREP